MSAGRKRHVTVITGRIMGPARRSVRPSVRLSVPHTGLNSKTKKRRKKQNWRKVPQDRINRCANFQFKRSKINVIKNFQKMTHIYNNNNNNNSIHVYGCRLARRRPQPLHRHRAVGRVRIALLGGRPHTCRHKAWRHL